MRKVHKDQAERILDFLCTKVLTGKKEQDREIASIALTTVIGEISGQELSCLIVRQVVPKLMQGIQAQVRRRSSWTHLTPATRLVALSLGCHSLNASWYLQDQGDVATSCLDILSEVLAKFGHLLTTEQGPLKTLLLQELSSSKAGIRKRAMACLGASSGDRATILWLALMKCATFLHLLGMLLCQPRKVCALQALWYPTCQTPCSMRSPRRS